MERLKRYLSPLLLRSQGNAYFWKFYLQFGFSYNGTVDVIENIGYVNNYSFWESQFGTKVADLFI